MEFNQSLEMNNCERIDEKGLFQARMRDLMEEYEYVPGEEDLEQMGISLSEYLNPTNEIVEKMEEYLREKLGRSL